MNNRITLHCVRLFPNSILPTKKFDRDSGFDVYIHRFIDAYLRDTMRGEILVEADRKGCIAGITHISADGSPISLTLNPGERVRVGTGVSLHAASTDPSEVFELQVRPRSGVSWDKCLMVINSPGTVDDPYRGEVIVQFVNNSMRAQTISVKDKIAQIVPVCVALGDVQEVPELFATERGDKGFGHSGK